ncbi:RluA family pseudouridine synthase [uncultured Arcobacter sp.]|uniref:RluA family pseudouridine synthase n=1 Tax=uncultured Arcobacter sp. TaxID=165434 RepID=UPI002609F499|nr:RluA family pseudouridine synthase [uncultured Arcobacter sp.]
MPFILKEYPALSGEKIQVHLVKNLKIKTSTAQKSISKGRVFDETFNTLKYGDIIDSDLIYMAQFEGHTRGLKPLFQSKFFAIFEKPSGIVVHPISKNTEYCLLDEVRYHFGPDANLVHRIDAETSGLIMCAKDRDIESKLKLMFEEKKYKKSYLAIIKGELKESVTIDTSIQKEGKNIGVRMEAGLEGKKSKTIVNPLQYNEKKDLTLVEAIPVTGRQHQIRVHLYSIGHAILGDPIYGVEDEFADAYLDRMLDEEKRKEVSGCHRLWLHANYLEFSYEGVLYKIYSKNKDLYNKFME